MNKKDVLVYSDVLFQLFNKIRKEGLMSVEGDVEGPEDSKLFANLDPIYHSFVADVTRLMIGGNLESEDISDYCNNIITLENSNERIIVLKFLSIGLISTCKGYAPQVAVEFARSCIPHDYKPSFNEVETYLKEQKYQRIEELERNTEKTTIESKIEQIMKLLNKN